MISLSHLKITLLILLASQFPAWSQCIIEGEESHRFLTGGWNSGGVKIFNDSGNSEWVEPSNDEMSDAWLLPDNSVIFSFSRKKKDEAGVIMLDSDGQKTWEYRVAKGHVNHSCQPLTNGGFLLGECSREAIWMVEINSEGEETKRIKVGENPKDYHHALRQVRKTPEGTYLGCIMTENKTYEWDENGNIVLSFPNGTYVAIRLPNGNTLTSGSIKTGPIVEYSKSGDIVWKVTQDDVPFHLNMPCGLHRLPNGNTVISNIWHGKNTDKTAPMLFEMTRDKKVVWKVFSVSGNMGNIQILDIDKVFSPSELLR